MTFTWSTPEEMIVCRDERQAQLLRRRVRAAGDGARHIRVVTPSMAQIMGTAPQRITVLPGVDLFQQIDGAMPLRSLLRRRQLVWGDRAVFIEL